MSERLYSLLLQLYPRAFRERYGEEMARVFRDRLRDEPSARLWIDVLSDAAMSIPRQYLVQAPSDISTVRRTAANQHRDSGTGDPRHGGSRCVRRFPRRRSDRPWGSRYQRAHESCPGRMAPAGCAVHRVADHDTKVVARLQHYQVGSR